MFSLPGGHFRIVVTDTLPDKNIYSLWPKTIGGTWFETSLFYEILDKKYLKKKEWAFII